MTTSTGPISRQFELQMYSSGSEVVKTEPVARPGRLKRCVPAFFMGVSAAGAFAVGILGVASVLAVYLKLLGH